ncbi:hypothetical protein [Chryseobacterium pennipullorum]|uniref:Uncharacterized protein n=1 Tax=Chryseobacterium pennipullorum TaxID=2258963 RepID=A0A3D9B0I8_9FLAO|nr:hypothetical protein [Chryseobacterium pennipullorum]REC46746.1 hypothetical protein DRF67_13040 [Chryseobacterium pennipullorum]
MNTQRFYKKEGSQYVFKNQPVFISVLVLIFLAIGVLTFNNVRILSLIIFALVVIMVLNFFAKKFVIDTERQTITGKASIFVPAKTYSFQDFTNFEVLAMKYMGFITTNVMLSIHFEVNGKHEKLSIGQALTRREIQKMVNETEDIMNINTPGDERNRPL